MNNTHICIVVGDSTVLLERFQNYTRSTTVSGKITKYFSDDRDIPRVSGTPQDVSITTQTRLKFLIYYLFDRYRVHFGFLKIDIYRMSKIQHDTTN